MFTYISVYVCVCVVFVEDVMGGEDVLFTSFSDLIQINVGGSEVVASSFFTALLLPHFQIIA